MSTAFAILSPSLISNEVVCFFSFSQSFISKQSSWKRALLHMIAPHVLTLAILEIILDFTPFCCVSETISVWGWSLVFNLIISNQKFDSSSRLRLALFFFLFLFFFFFFKAGLIYIFKMLGMYGVVINDWGSKKRRFLPVNFHPLCIKC